MQKSKFQKTKILGIKKLLIAIIIFSVISLINITLENNKTNASWQTKTFINQDFWAASPSSGNILAALFGDQSSLDSSPYTRFWTGINCDIKENDVVYVDNSKLSDLTGNKIYLIKSGTITGAINPKSCSAIVGVGDVIFSGNGISITGNNIIIDNIKIKNNNGGTGIYLSGSNSNTINNVEISNTNTGILLDESNYNAIHNSRVYNNKAGIYLNYSSDNYINKSQIYNHTWDEGVGIFIKSPSNNKPSNYNTINNSLIYNNDIGILMGGIIEENIPISILQTLFGVYAQYSHNVAGTISYNTIINSQLFKNNISFKIRDLNEGLLNRFYNSSIYNSKTGLYHSSAPLKSVILSSGYVFNNQIANKGNFVGSGHIYIFGNSLTGNDLTGSYTLHTGHTVSYHRMTNPVNADGVRLLSGTNRTAMRGTGNFTATQPIKYIFGKKVPKQVQPMKWDGSSRALFGTKGLDRDSEDFIASVDMEINPEDENLVNYYYGPDSEFAANWNENNCSLGAFTVEYINNQADFSGKLSNPLGHTIYVLNLNTSESPQVINTETVFTANNNINIQDNCIAIVKKRDSDNITIKGSQTNELIKISAGENIILDGLNLDGNNKYQYGILLEKSGNYSSNNNTFNNIKSYNHTKDGIRLGLGSSYNTIMNTQTWNNIENGIEISYAGKFNIINNSLSYNNKGYGIIFGNLSEYNTINNSQFFNNNSGGIFSDLNSKENVLNNIHTYNNKEYGLNIRLSSKNTLDNVHSYNNKIGINISDIYSIDNKYRGNLVLFANSQSDFIGTNGNDIYLSPNGGKLYTGGESMSCMWATNPRLEDNWLLETGLNCTNTGKIDRKRNDPNNISYLFGLGISKQIAPVGYSGENIVSLNNQHNTNSYIGEINPIWWTNPGNITILSGYDTNLELNTGHEMIVTYSGMINHNFDVNLTGNFSGLDIDVKIKYENNNNWTSIGTGQEDVDFTIQGIKIVLTTPEEYNQTVSGTIYIGTDQYGSGSASFEIKTKPDPTPPTITWSGNISTEALWYGEANTWQAIISGVYTADIKYSYVTGADDCTTGTSGTDYSGSQINITGSNYNELNDKYVCIVAKDTVNGEYATGLSNQIKISEIDFIDGIETGPVNYDIIDINFQHMQNYGYKRITDKSNCNAIGMANTIWGQYDGSIVINNGSLNGQYMCLYGKDGTGSPRYVVSNNKLNINNYSNIVSFICDVSPIRVTNDVISIYFNTTVTFSNKKYKWVNIPVECSNSGSMQDYTGSLNIDHQGFNGKYFCLYTREQNGTENYLVSSHKVKVDITNPKEPTIIAPTSGQNLHRLVIQALGASDSESGLAGYEYQIAQNATFLDVVSSGIVYTTEETFSPIFDLPENSYAIRIRSVDNVGNTSNRSTTVEFNYKTLANFAFENINNAQLGTSYTSNQITMGGLGVNETIIAKVNNGILLRNGNVLGTSGLVQNNDKLSIKMNSSNNYNELVKTELKIANRIIPRAIKTISTGQNWEDLTGFNLTDQEKLEIQAMFDSIVAMYQNQSQLYSFLTTMSSMLKDNIILAEEGKAEKLRYLLYLIKKYLAEHFGEQMNENLHKAPNCKIYTIVYDTGDNTYYSPNTVKKYKFGSRDELVKYLDVNNPGDCHINVYGNTVSYNNTDPNKHIAPNGKVYRIESNNLGYSSPDFISIKYFASIAELRAFIDKNNPAIIVRDHVVDTEFEPITHTAPNGKSYKIYKTNKGYMSYKLMKVQYYGSLDELKNHIDKNNKK